MNEVIVIKRRRNWEWQVRDKDGELIIGGRERSRPAARYQGYRTLFMMLAVGRRTNDIRVAKGVSGKAVSARGELETCTKSPANLVRPKTGRSQ
jgi:hypothetical protein